MVVNTDSAAGAGRHWLAALDINGARLFNDPLGAAGRRERQALLRQNPGGRLAEDDGEQDPRDKDCGVRSLVALAIGVRCGAEAFLAL